MQSTARAHATARGKAEAATACNELKEGAQWRTGACCYVLEVPNKSSNILNTFGLSKSHRSGIAEPAAAPACRVLVAALALAISHARAHARTRRKN